MTKKKEEDQPERIGLPHRIIVNPSRAGRASICSWDLQFSFKTREQCTSFMNELLETSDIPWNISYEQTDENTHVVNIEDMAWANNLTFVAKILERVDYKGS